MAGKDPRGRKRNQKSDMSTMRLKSKNIDLVDSERRDGESRDDCIVRVFGEALEYQDYCLNKAEND